jgi:NitT/TauT family transport system substrate-binding protein
MKSLQAAIGFPPPSFFSLKSWGIVLLTFFLLGSGGTELWAKKLRVGVLKWGTVNWELNVIQHHGFAKAEGVELEVVGFAGKNATAVALQSGSVDMIVTDWVWVSRQRAEGENFTFFPYSRAVGSLLVAPDSGIRSFKDLQGKRLGIAGGPVDKSWLVVRALAKQQEGIDLNASVEKVFGAPPLLNQQILSGKLDAVINFWHYIARLEAQGLKPLVTIGQAIETLGAGSDVPMLGYAFRENWANANKEIVQGFARSSRRAKALLADSQSEWDRLRPKMKAKDDATFNALRDSYRAGIPGSWGETERAAAKRLFAVLAKQGGKKLVGKSLELQAGTFWPHVSY